MAQQALEVLHVVAQLQLPSTSSGQALLPLPRAHRQLSSPRCLPHLAQVPLRHCLSSRCAGLGFGDAHALAVHAGALRMYVGCQRCLQSAALHCCPEVMHGTLPASSWDRNLCWHARIAGAAAKTHNEHSALGLQLQAPQIDRH